MIDKVLILNKLKEHLGFTKNSDFARYLGIKDNTLSNWYSRNTFNEDIITHRCEFVNKSWLLTGEGQMLKENNSPINNNNMSMDEKERIGILEEALDIMKKELSDKQRTIDALTESNRELISYVTGNPVHKKKEAI